MEATAFAPGHISGFFEPVFNPGNMYQTGSRGAGINISLGVYSTVIVEKAQRQVFKVYLNEEEIYSPLIHRCLKSLLGDKSVQVVVKTTVELPIRQGFGMSAASAVSTCYALAKLMRLPVQKAMEAAHTAEVTLKTGLGDVSACCTGGIEIRGKPGIPPWGYVEQIPGKYEVVLCVIQGEIDTHEVLSNPRKMRIIKKYGKWCTDELVRNPSLEKLFSLSRLFAEKTGLASEKVSEAIETASHHGMASMCMLGNSVFAIGDTEKLSIVLSSFGDIFVCNVDEDGARVLENKS